MEFVGRPTPIYFIGRPTPIYFIGDSHVLIFRDLLFKGPHGAGLFIARGLYVNGLTAAGFLGASGFLSAPVVDALRAEHLVVENGDGWEPYHLSSQRHWKAVARAEDRRPVDPVILFSCGALDVLGPAEAPSEEGVREIIRPLFAGLQFLKALGFRRLFLLLPTSPGLAGDDERYEKFFGHRASVSARYERLLLLNNVVVRSAADAGVRFIDLWQAVMRDGSLDPQYYLDGFHLNAKAALLAVRAVVANLDDTGAC